MTEKAINNSNYTLRYIVFNEREKEDEKSTSKKVILKLEIVPTL